MVSKRLSNKGIIQNVWISNRMNVTSNSSNTFLPFGILSKQKIVIAKTNSILLSNWNMILPNPNATGKVIPDTRNFKGASMKEIAMISPHHKKEIAIIISFFMFEKKLKDMIEIMNPKKGIKYDF